MRQRAIIFDVDGTLIDSNHAHVQAWDRALKQHHYQVSLDRIAVEIGKGGDKLVPSLLGTQIDQCDGESLRNAHSKEFIAIAESTKLKTFAGVERLMSDLRNQGVRVALGTSSKKQELLATQKSAAAEWIDDFDVIATGEDSSESKPAPGILEAAIRKLKLTPPQCLMVGDTPYDAETARDAGTISFGFTCGGMNDHKALRAAGMRRVLRDPEDLRSQLDSALDSAWPGSADLNIAMIESLMHEALSVAGQALGAGEVPIGCVIARGDGVIIARGYNELNRSQNKAAHAEMIAFDRAAGKVPTDARDLILVSTLEPCVMCLGACMEAAVDTIIYALPAPIDGGRRRVTPPISPESQMPRMLGGILAEQSKSLLQQFLCCAGKNPAQIKFVQDLLAAQ